MQDEKPFKTSDLGLAAYLAYMGMTLLGCVDSGEGGRLLFVFTPNERSADFVEAFTTGQGTVSASRYARYMHMCSKHLKKPVTL